MIEMRYQFRGRDVKNGEWRYGFLWYDAEMMQYHIRSVHNTDYVVDADTVGQCTGLYDVLGKYIFEGDVVHYNRYTSRYVLRRVVFRRDGFVGVRTLDDRNPLTVDTDMIVVRGNIYDNPDMLKMNGRRIK